MKNFNLKKHVLKKDRHASHECNECGKTFRHKKFT